MRFASLISILLLCPFVLYAAELQHSREPQTQAEINAQACGDLKQSESKLDTIYKKIVGQYSYDKQFIKYLQESQDAWIKYRTAELGALYPNEYRVSYGSIYITCSCDELNRMTKERIEELNRWLARVDENQACHGTIRTK